MKNSVVSVVSALLVSTALSPAAYAQAEAAPEAATETAGGIGDIVVTAQRRVESSQKAAIAISVVQPDALATVTAPIQLTKVVPALQIGSGGGTTPLIYIRGVGTLSGNPYTDSAVAINYDGVYLGRPSSTSGLFYDLERVEVLKGPQGTLYGRNSTGGAMNILPAKPVLGKDSMDFSLSYGNYDAVNAQAAVNMSLTDSIALRAAGITYSHDGYMSDGSYSEKGSGGRLQLLVDPGRGWSVRLSGDYFKMGGTGPAATILGTVDSDGNYVESGLGKDVGLNDARTDEYLSTVSVGSAGATYGAVETEPGVNNEYYGFQAEFKADLGFADLVVVPALRRVKRDETYNPGAFNLTTDETDKQFSFETRLSGRSGPVEWLAGVYYFDESVKSTFVVDNRVQGGVQYIDQDSESYAGFGRLTWHLSDRFRLTGAGRYTKDRKDFDGHADNIQAICTSVDHQCSDIRRLPSGFTSVDQAMSDIGYVQANSTTYVDSTGASDVIYSYNRTDVKETIKSSKFTWRGGVEFDLGPRSLLYASVETGYRSGGFSFSSVEPTVDPESIIAYTIGSKNRFWDNKVQLNVEAFLWKYKDQQITHFGRGLNNEIELVTENIGRSTNKGVEVEMLVKPVPNTLLRADVQYLDAKYDDFVYEEADVSPSSNPGSVRPTTGCRVSSTVNAKGKWDVDCSGKRAQYSPKWTMNFGVEQTVPLSDTLKLVLNANTHYQSSSVVVFEQLDGLEQEAYWMSDASVTLGAQDDQWALTAYVENIENYRTVNSVVLNSVSSAVGGVVGPPRTYGLRFKASF